MSWTTVLFDLDGTLIDSGEGIKKSLTYALSALGYPTMTDKEMDVFIGPPLVDKLQEIFQVSQDEAARIVAKYRERYKGIGLYESAVYDGIRECLDNLKSRGLILGVASSKPEPMVKEVLAHYGLDAYFSIMVGSTYDGVRSSKKDVIEEALLQLGIDKSKASVIYVGDRLYDVQGARMCGLDCIGAAWGYGGFAELADQKALFIASTPAMLVDIIDEENKPKTPGREEKEPKRTGPVFTGGHVPYGRNTDPLPLCLWRVMYPWLIYLLITEIIVYFFIFLDGVIYGVTGVDIIRMLHLTDDYPMLMQGLAIVITLPFLVWFINTDNIKRKIGGRYKFGPMTKRPFTIMDVLGTIILIIASCIVVSFLITVSPIPTIDAAYQQVNETFDRTSFPVLLIVVCVLGPVCEEMIFRGLVQRRIRDYAGPKTAIILSAACFGIFHMNLTQGIFAFAMGILLAALYEKYGNIAIPIAAHAANNVYNSFFIEETSPVIPAIILILVSAIASCTLIWLFFFRKDAKKA